MVCKADTELPELPGTERWEEPDEPRHPLTGIVHALESAGGPVLVCAADMPFVTADACRTLMQAPGSTPGRRGDRRGRSCSPRSASTRPPRSTSCAGAPPGAPLTRTVEQLDPVRVALPAALVQSVNTPQELAEAEALLG